MGRDVKILDFFSIGLKNRFLDGFFKLFTKLGDLGLFWICLSIVYMLIPKKRDIGKVVAISLILHLVLVNLIIKPAFFRPRPYMVRPRELLVVKLFDGSFPSGHASASFAATTVILKMEGNNWIKCSCLLIASLISISRLYLYLHYPSDVFAGIIIGILMGEAACKIFIAINKN